MKVDLAEMIGQLRTELTEAMRAGADSELRFEIGTVELELAVQVQKEARPGAKVRFWVVEAGVDTAVSSVSTHTIKLSLDPRHVSAPDRSPLISGAEVDGERR
ncbi:trypco2 family protein [Actinomadura sp. 7K534]|uniref:trypco2 family protein n=1 Tax=Actinomadura sp. 7K534 TaxID=2530366 RepID=UPI00104C3785|nr:trypco2 family protein [Actinomadura sp. 7K534]TDB98530.1 hypothetical protein E1266_03020 [Actinomadura sp. 7K534]